MANATSAGGKQVGYYLSWDNVSCSIQGKVILDGCSGYCAPGQSICILGASGSGKTTLVDILSYRKTTGTIGGEILVNGQKPDALYTRRIGYVASETEHIPTMTVRECLQFAAEMKMPGKPTAERRRERVQELLVGLHLDHVAEVRVGNELMRGISSGEKKRLDIGLEMVGEPKLLFLDEPTSGLDEYASRFTMNLVLQTLKAQSITCVVVIHQPSFAVFSLFDNVCLLGATKACYFGKVSFAETFFSKMGQPTPQFVNPIEHYLDVISAAPFEVSKYYEISDVRQQTAAKIKDITNVVGSVENFETDVGVRPLYERNDFVQFWYVLVRITIRYARNPSTSYGRVAIAVITGLLYGCVFFQLGDDLAAFRMRFCLASSLGFMPAFMSASSLSQFLEDRDLYIQEFNSSYYRTLPYYFSYVIVENVICTIITTLQVVIIFFMSGLDRTNFGEFLGVMILQSFISVSVAIMIGTWSKSLMQAYSGLVAFGLVEFVFSGVSVNLISLNNAFLTFISQIDYWRYTVTYLLYIEFKDLVINCDVSENIPVIMDEILPSIGAQVMAVVGGVIPDKTNATLLHDHLQEWLELAALYWLAGSLSVNAATGVATVNASVLPLALPGSQAATYSASVATEIGQDIGFTLADIPIMTAGGRIVGVPANLTAQLLPAVQAYSLWKDIGTLSAQGKWFPDYSRCAVSDTLSFIEANYGIDPTLYPNVKLIAIAFFVVFTIAGYFGLHFSRRYKKR